VFYIIIPPSFPIKKQRKNKQKKKTQKQNKKKQKQNKIKVIPKYL